MKFYIRRRKNKQFLLTYIGTCIAVVFIALTLVINDLEEAKLNKPKDTWKKATVIITKEPTSNKEENTTPEPEPEPEPIPEPTPEPEVITPVPETPITPPPAPAPVIPDANTDIATYVQSLHVTGIGDSIMLGAVPSLYAIFPNGYFDAAVSRQIPHAFDVINYLTYSGVLGDPIIINLGANSYYNDDVKRSLINALQGKEVFWLTVTNNHMVGINEGLRNLGNEIPNLHIIDWEAISIGHPEYFGADGIHLTGEGQVAYANAIYSALCTFYLQKYPELSE